LPTFSVQKMKGVISGAGWSQYSKVATPTSICMEHKIK